MDLSIINSEEILEILEIQGIVTHVQWNSRKFSQVRRFSSLQVQGENELVDVARNLLEIKKNSWFESIVTFLRYPILGVAPKFFIRKLDDFSSLSFEKDRKGAGNRNFSETSKLINGAAYASYGEINIWRSLSYKTSLQTDFNFVFTRSIINPGASVPVVRQYIYIYIYMYIHTV